MDYTPRLREITDPSKDIGSSLFVPFPVGPGLQMKTLSSDAKHRQDDVCVSTAGVTLEGGLRYDALHARGDDREQRGNAKRAN
ncbi:hypothetical protein LTR74_013979 [Friedmanniomyces endolithicus]|nr:hypothetical protein LTR74_013979 [Friedmanniomyces endolithicus]